MNDPLKLSDDLKPQINLQKPTAYEINPQGCIARLSLISGGEYHGQANPRTRGNRGDTIWTSKIAAAAAAATAAEQRKATSV